jgi:hypothetical protein
MDSPSVFFKGSEVFDLGRDGMFLQKIFEEVNNVLRVVYAVSCSHSSLDQLAQDLAGNDILQRGATATFSEMVELVFFERAKGWADKKLISKTGMCTTCLAKFEMNLRVDGTFPFYEDYKITNNKLAYIRDYKDKIEEALRGVRQQMEIVTEDGRIEKWTWEVDIEKVKEDLKKDIDGAYNAIEELLLRKAALEEKLVELNHPELVKK